MPHPPRSYRRLPHALLALITALAMLAGAQGSLSPQVARADYSSYLVAPTPPDGARTFVWQATGVKAGPGQEISHIELRGCWTAGQIATATAQDASSRPVSVTVHTGGPKVNAIETENIADNSLPIRITVTFKDELGSAPDGVDLFAKTGGGRTAGTHFDVGGPTCAPPTDPPPPDSGEGFEQASPGLLQLSNASTATFTGLASPISFAVTDASLSANPADVRVFLNDDEAPASAIQLAGNTITVASGLVEGRNDLVVLAADSAGYALSAEATLWAGNRTLNVSVLDENGQPATGAVVTAKLSDDLSVTATGTSSNGQVSFANLPNRTIILDAVASGNRFASVATYGGAGTIQLKLVAFNPTSTVANNDFSLGTDGWNIGAAPVQIIAHTESGGGAPQTFIAQTSSETQALAAESNMDLSLNTSGEGPQSISRTFQVAPGTSAVDVRFRFITSEVPGGYFGSQYNDYYNVSIRSQSGGAAEAESQSMNGLGLGAFDGAGATSWREASLPVNVAGDTVQVDLTVANVADGLYDSQLVVDLVSEQPLKITADKEKACVNQTVTFRPEGSPAGTIAWTGGGNPATASGNTFATRFSSTGEKTVQATLTNNGRTSTDSAKVKINERSGRAWVARFPTSTSTADLTPTFRTTIDNFISALRAGGATVTIAATYRPRERAYLMHYAYRVAREGLNPASVPAMDGVDICWQHYDANGNADVAAARAAADQMVSAYAIRYAPALRSRHTERRAIDMNVSWSGDLRIVNGNGTAVTITSTPRTGAGNTDLHAVGATFGARKLVGDPPHWSDDGR